MGKISIDWYTKSQHSIEIDLGTAEGLAIGRDLAGDRRGKLSEEEVRDELLNGDNDFPSFPIKDAYLELSTPETWVDVDEVEIIGAVELP